MSTFKVGDKVRIMYRDDLYLAVGTVSYVKERAYNTPTYTVQFEDGSDRNYGMESSLELVTEPAKGIKHDRNKHRWGLVPWAAMRQVLAALEHGAKKYGDHNWQKVEPFEDRYREALARHVVDYMEGRITDEETGLPTLAHVVCNALFLLAGPKK